MTQAFKRPARQLIAPSIVSVEIDLQDLIILSCIFSGVLDWSRYTSSFSVPHKKKSRGVKSGERAGYGMCPLRRIQRLGTVDQTE